MSDKVFWYEKNGEKHCCFTASELKALALSGEIDSSCLIWKEGTKNWIPATSVRGLLPAEPPPAPLQDSIPPVVNPVSPEPEQETTAEPPNSPDEADSSGLKNWIIQKFQGLNLANKWQNLDLISRWKSLSLVKKILCIAAIVSAIAIGLFNLLVLLVILLPVLWFIALFKPRIVRANTRMQATKQFAFSFILVVVGASILASAKNESSVAASPASVSASPPVNAAPAADVAMPETAETPVESATTIPNTDFIDNGDGTVTHKTTGLIWMRCSIGKEWNGSTCLSRRSIQYGWQEALDFAHKFSYAGYSDWRVPTIKELNTLVYCSNGYTRKYKQDGYFSDGGCRGDYKDPTIVQAAFPDTPSLAFWSSSPSADDSYIAWAVDFHFGFDYRDNKGYTHPVLLVRGGQ